MAFCIRIATAWILAAGWARAGQGLSPDGHLDSAAVRDAYLRADMEFVRGVLEGYIKSHPKDVSAGEKIFTHLYLGAAYSGEPGGEARSEAHFRAALRLDPGADPDGLYLAPAIKEGFEGLRAEARTRTAASGRGPVTARQGIPGPEQGIARSEGTQKGAAPEGVSSVRGEGSIDPGPGRSGGFSAMDKEPAATGGAGTGPAAGARQELSGGSNGTGKAGRVPGGVVRKESGRGWLWWTLGGTAGAAAVGAGTLGWILADSDAQPRRVRIDATLK